MAHFWGRYVVAELEYYFVRSDERYHTKSYIIAFGLNVVSGWCFTIRFFEACSDEVSLVGGPIYCSEAPISPTRPLDGGSIIKFAIIVGIEYYYSISRSTN